MGRVNVDHLAKEAARLLADDVLKEALIRIQNEAYEALSRADVDDKTAILRLQQKIAVTNEIPAVLEAFILEGKPAEIRRGFA